MTEHRDETVVASEPGPPRAPSYKRRLSDMPVWYLVVDRFGAPIALLIGLAFGFWRYAEWTRSDAKEERAMYIQSVGKCTDVVDRQTAEIRSLHQSLDEMRRKR